MALPRPFWRFVFDREAGRWRRRVRDPRYRAFRDATVKVIAKATDRPGPIIDLGCGPGNHSIVVTVVPRDAWWAPAWWLGHPQLDVYVNINAPAAVSQDRIRYVDLDLDVVRWLSGECEIIDQDEFDAHRESLRYPQEVVEGAQQAADTALSLLRAETAPFDGAAAQRWTERARAARLPAL